MYSELSRPKYRNRGVHQRIATVTDVDEQRQAQNVPGGNQPLPTHSSCDQQRNNDGGHAGDDVRSCARNSSSRAA